MQMCHGQTFTSQPGTAGAGGGGIPSAGVSCFVKHRTAVQCVAKIAAQPAGSVGHQQWELLQGRLSGMLPGRSSSSRTEATLRLASQRLQAVRALSAAAWGIWTFSSSSLALSVSPSLLCSPPPASGLTEQLGRQWDRSSDINLSWCGMRGINIQRVM